MADEIDNYHAYLNRAERIPQLMKDSGTISIGVRIDGRDILADEEGLPISEYPICKQLTFDQEGRVRVTQNLSVYDHDKYHGVKPPYASERIPITDLDRLLELTFAHKIKAPTRFDRLFEAPKPLIDYTSLALETLNYALSEIERTRERALKTQAEKSESQT